MSCSPVYSVWCDVNGEDCIGWEAQESNISNARKSAKIRGWHRKKWRTRYFDICPYCIDELEALNQQDKEQSDE